MLMFTQIGMLSVWRKVQFCKFYRFFAYVLCMTQIGFGGLTVFCYVTI